MFRIECYNMVVSCHCVWLALEAVAMRINTCVNTQNHNRNIMYRLIMILWMLR